MVSSPLAHVKTLIAGLVVALVLAGGWPGIALASPYGQGTYSSCPFGQPCATPTSTSPEPETIVTPPAGTSTTVAGYSLNLQDGQQIATSPYGIIVTLINSGDASLVDRVEFFVNGTSIGTVTQPDADGTYRVSWDIDQHPGTLVRVVLYDKDGNAIPKEITVSRRTNQPSPSQAPGAGGSTTPTPGQQVSRAVETAKEAIKHTPPPVAYAFPYILFIVLLAVALSLLYRTQQEARQIAEMTKLADQEEALAEEKTAFVQLTSHYFRTPLTSLKSGLEMLLSVQKITPTLSQTLRSQVDALGTKIEGVLAKITTGVLPPEADAPVASPRRAWLRPQFLVPVGLVAVLAVTADWLFINVAGIPIALVNLLTETLVFVAVIILLSNALRSRESQKQRWEHVSAILNRQTLMDTARNLLINDSVAILSRDIEQLRGSLPQLSGLRYAEIVEKGFSQIDTMLRKFGFVAKLQSGQLSTTVTEFNLNELVERVRHRYEALLGSKQIQLLTTGTPVKVLQNENLIEEVISTLVDNAVKFSQPGGRIEVKYQQDGQGLSLQISDQGSGIAPDKQSQLFHPFVRGGSVLEYNYEGIGLSLYLDKLIMNYLRGDITLQSQPGRGTQIGLVFPVGSRQRYQQVAPVLAQAATV